MFFIYLAMALGVAIAAWLVFGIGALVLSGNAPTPRAPNRFVLGALVIALLGVVAFTLPTEWQDALNISIDPYLIAAFLAGFLARHYGG